MNKAAEQNISLYQFRAVIMRGDDPLIEEGYFFTEDAPNDGARELAQQDLDWLRSGSGFDGYVERRQVGPWERL